MHAGRKLIYATRPITTVDDLSCVAGLTGSSLERAKQLLVKGFLPDLVAAQQSSVSQSMAYFRKVWGAGDTTVRAWVCAHGCRTLEDVVRLDMEGSIKLTIKQVRTLVTNSIVIPTMDG